MKKVFATTLFLLGFWAVGHAQLGWGLRFGASTSRVSPDRLLITDSGTAESFWLDVKGKPVGYNAGLFLRYVTLVNVFVHAELHFSTTATKYTLESTNAAIAASIAKETHYDLNLPVHVGYMLGGMGGNLGLRFQGGPILTRHLGGNTDFRDLVDDYRQSFDAVSVGWQAGLGVDVAFLLLDIRYEGDLAKYANHMEFSGKTSALMNGNAC